MVWDNPTNGAVITDRKLDSSPTAREDAQNEKDEQGTGVRGQGTLFCCPQSPDS